MKELTDEQQRIFEFLRDQLDSGFMPTVREIASQFGYKSPNAAAQHLRLIEQKGYIRRTQGKARGIEILVHRPTTEDTSTIEVPIVGQIAAGSPILATENIEGTMKVDKDMFRGTELFTLHVRGDSMRDIGIMNGDMAIINKQSTVDSGEVSAVIIDGEATLKRFFRREDKIILKAENTNYKDIILNADNEVCIAGKLIGVVRAC